jgi:hypothetical protein
MAGILVNFGTGEQLDEIKFKNGRNTVNFGTGEHAKYKSNLRMAEIQ